MIMILIVVIREIIKDLSKNLERKKLI